MYKENQKNKSSNNKKGFTLMELLVAMAVFSIIALATVAAFASGMQSQRKAREIQNNVAAAKTAMDLAAKTMRFSKNLGPAGATSIVRMYNTSQGWCINYRFNNGSKQLERADDRNPDDPSDCASFNPSNNSYTPLILNATGSFDIDETGSDSIGKATILVNIGSDHLQTSVSFRDYEGIVQ